jgi:putative hydrolase of the HAD superfamily
VSRWQALVFDLDDTLYPERQYVLGGFRAVAAWAERHLGIPSAQGYAELASLFEGGVRGDTFDRWLAARALSPEPLAARLVEVYRDHEPALECFPGVVEVLGSLRERYRVGLLSDGHLGVQRRKLAALRLAGYFDAIVFSDEWGRSAWKPSPRPFEIVLQRLGVEGPRGIYVADNPAKDFLGARRCGMGTIRVRRAGGEYASLDAPSLEHAPDRTIADLSMLEAAVASIPGPPAPAAAPAPPTPRSR